MTQINLEAAKALCNGAAKGPWLHNERGISDTFVWESAKSLDECCHIWVGPQNWYLTEADAAFIAASRELVPALIDEIERQRDSYDQLAMELAEWKRLPYTEQLDKMRAAERTYLLSEIERLKTILDGAAP